MSSAPFVPVIVSLPFSTWAVAAAVACATVKPSAAAASAPVASARERMPGCMGSESFRGEERACCLSAARARNVRICPAGPEE